MSEREGSGTNWLIGIIIALALLAIAYLVFSANSEPARHNDTDPAKGRSGLDLYTDAGTGCQYVSTLGRTLTPRLGADGKPKCGTTAP